MLLHELLIDIEVTEAPESINWNTEVKECCARLKELLGENEIVEVFTGFLHLPLNDSVDDADAMAPSEHVDEKHEVLVIVVNFWELNNNQTCCK